MVLQPHMDRCEPEGTGLKELATDPYIIVAAGYYFFFIWSYSQQILLNFF